MYTTGIPACDALREIAFTGNIIPQSWYKIFVKRDLKNPKPHLLAINVLADIVYWYRPAEVRDERSGEVVGYRKKFAADLLQRSYAQIAEQFGCSEGQAKDAIVFLEEMGVVRREFRTIEAKGMKYAGTCVFFCTPLCRNFTGGACRFQYPCAGISPEGCRKIDRPCAGISPVYREYDTRDHNRKFNKDFCGKNCPSDRRSAARTHSIFGCGESGRAYPLYPGAREYPCTGSETDENARALALRV